MENTIWGLKSSRERTRKTTYPIIIDTSAIPARLVRGICLPVMKALRMHHLVLIHHELIIQTYFIIQNYVISHKQFDYSKLVCNSKLRYNS